MCRKYSKKIAIANLERVKFAVDGQLTVKKFQQYVAGLQESAQQDKDEAELAERARRMNI